MCCMCVCVCVCVCLCLWVGVLANVFYGNYYLHSKFIYIGNYYYQEEGTGAENQAKVLYVS